MAVSFLKQIPSPMKSLVLAPALFTVSVVIATATTARSTPTAPTARDLMAAESIAPSGVGAQLEDSPKAVLDQAWQIVNQEYVDSQFNHTDWQATRQELLGREYTSREAAYGALRAAGRAAS